MRKSIYMGSALMLVSLAFTITTHAGTDALEQAVNHAQRSKSNTQRDVFRHPKETLEFFGIKPDMTVVELWPGGGWYTEILQPYLADQGHLYAAHFDPNSSVEYFQRSRAKFEQDWAAAAKSGRFSITTFDPPEFTAIAPAASADAVLTFRNVHNWYMRGGGQDRLSSAFAAMYTALKPGGVLGIVDHRLPAERALSDQDASGYMREDFVINVAEQAGFKLVARSEINANPLDSADHPKGVWTLPPSLRMGEENAAEYLSIGESDRMTLKFIKPN